MSFSKGWRRLSIVLSVLWILGSTVAYFWVYYAYRSTPTIALPVDVAFALFSSDPYWPSYKLTGHALLSLGSLAVLWISIALGISAVRWVQAGFAGEANGRNGSNEKSAGSKD